MAAVTRTQKGIEGKIEALQEAILQLQQQIQSSWNITVTITTLAPEPYQLKRDIPVLVQQDEDSYIATFVDANINASGDTLSQAVDNLKDMMVALLRRFSQEKNKLGKWPTKQLAILQDFIQKK